MPKINFDVAKIGADIQLHTRAILARRDSNNRPPDQYNLRSILLHLTGRDFAGLSDRRELHDARRAVETALVGERKKARQQRSDYSLNRHIALHQARKTLDKLPGTLPGNSVQAD